MDSDTQAPTRMNKQALKSALIELGYSESQLLDDNGKPMKRPALLDMLQNHKQESQDFAVLAAVEEDDEIGIAVETQEDDQEDDSLTEAVIPSPSDAEWTQYVLGQFMDDEVDGQNPRVEGLRRVAGELVGELIEEGCDLVSPPTQDNNYRACVKAWGIFVTEAGVQKRFEALADAHGDNCFEDYATYLVAMADTRAKGRMYRNALCLRRVVAAEEVSKTVATAADIQQGGKIHGGQISLLRLLSEREEISISKVLDELSIPYELNENTGDVKLTELSYEDALAATKKIRELKEQKGAE